MSIWDLPTCLALVPEILGWVVPQSMNPWHSAWLSGCLAFPGVVWERKHKSESGHLKGRWLDSVASHQLMLWVPGAQSHKGTVNWLTDMVLAWFLIPQWGNWTFLVVISHCHGKIHDKTNLMKRGLVAGGFLFFPPVCEEPLWDLILIITVRPMA